MTTRHVRMVLLFMSPLTACGEQMVGWPIVDSGDDTADTADITAPLVTSTSPTNLQIDVPFGSSIFANFDENMAPLTLTTATFRVEDGVVIEGTVQPLGTTAIVFAPLDALEPEQEYTATITIGATDVAGNPLAQDYTWTFTTQARPLIVTPPTVTLTDPLDLAIGVPIQAIVDATFSEAMDPLTIIDANFELAGPGLVAVDGAVSYDPLTGIGTFTPDNDLLLDTTYTATVTTGVVDLDGIAMEEDYSWTFQTEQIPLLPPPVDLGILESFVAVAGVAITNSGPSYLNGDVGLSPGVASQCTACTPPDMFITGELHIADQIAADAKAALTLALIEAQGFSPPTETISADLHLRILPPGVYFSASTMNLSTNGVLVLDGQGDPNASWIFQVGSALTVEAGARVELIGGARAANVFWAVGSSSSLLENVQFQGTILAQESNSVGTNSSVVGRLLCTEGAITLLSNTITLPQP